MHYWNHARKELINLQLKSLVTYGGSIFSGLILSWVWKYSVVPHIDGKLFKIPTPRIENDIFTEIGSM